MRGTNPKLLRRRLCIGFVIHVFVRQALSGVFVANGHATARCIAAPLLDSIAMAFFLSSFVCSCLAHFVESALLSFIVICVLKTLVRRCAVPRSDALLRMRLRDLCLLRSRRLSRWPSLAPDFEMARHAWAKNKDCSEHQALLDSATSARTESVSSVASRSVQGHEVEPASLAPVASWPLLTVDEVAASPDEARRLVWGLFSATTSSSVDNCMSTISRSLKTAEVWRHTNYSKRSLAGGAELEEIGAEAAMSYEFSPDESAAWLRVDMSWWCIRRWSLSRLASVLLHELAHVWHDSTDWAPADQFVCAHSAHFLAKCMALGIECRNRALPFYPNVFTESWSLLSNLDVGRLVDEAARRAWETLLREGSHFDGTLLEDLLKCGLQLTEAVAVKHRLNAANVAQAMDVGYEELLSWRRSVARSCMAYLADGGVLGVIRMRKDYVVVEDDFLRKCAVDRSYRSK